MYNFFRENEEHKKHLYTDLACERGRACKNKLGMEFTKIHSPIGIWEHLKVIDEEAFDRTGIVTLTIPEGVTTIAYSAFHQCEKLEQVSLPSTIKVLGASAFQTCTSLKTVIFAGTEDQFFHYVSKETNTFARCHEEFKIVYTEN